ncbi:MAG: MFS transporter [Thermoproteus sp. AZ2]|uniref:MFS transporter n=1 Tax=Thermoproteus sp. AZ2 TaxID=1609232 RepID=A0ACC6UYZ8_9CREN
MDRKAILINSVMGSLMASMTMSALVIALPAIFRGVGVDPLSPEGFTAMFWLILVYPFVVAISVAIIGRISDMWGKGRAFTVGAVLFTIASLLLGIAPGKGSVALYQLIIYRVLQAIGGSLMFSNSAAIIADVFPPSERGFAQGIIGISFGAGSILGLLIGGVLAVVDWRWVFLVNVPIGAINVLWAYRVVYNVSPGVGRVVVDVPGVAALASSLFLILLGLVFAMLPYGDSLVGWGNPLVWALIAAGLVLLAAIVPIERRAATPIFRLDLFKIRQFSFGVLSAFFLFMAQGANIFVLSLLLQAIYLPLHGIPYEDTPFWAGVYLIPSSIASAAFAPIGGKLLNKLGARVVATVGAVLMAIGFELLAALPMSFSYALFAGIIFLIGMGSGLFMSPNLVSILSSVPSNLRSTASGVRASLQNIGTLMSFAIFMTLIVIGSSAALAPSIRSALIGAGLTAQQADELLAIPPAFALFAAFLGYNPIATLAKMTGASIQPAIYAKITEPQFFASAIAPAMGLGFNYAYHLAAALALMAALLSYFRGREIFIE